jgi:peptidoglycan hydrolase CwlO-like protein
LLFLKFAFKLRKHLDLSMATPQEELVEVKARLDTNIATVQEIQKQIEKLNQQGQALTQPIMEDQGALKILQKLIDEPVV